MSSLTNRLVDMLAYLILGIATPLTAYTLWTMKAYIVVVAVATLVGTSVGWAVGRVLR